MMNDLRTMSTSRCWRRLGTDGVGRIGFDRGRGPRIHPVNYAVVDETIYLRTTEGSELADFVDMFGDGALVSFEADQLDAGEGDRWSVLVAARADRAAAPSPSRLPQPAPSGTRHVHVRLTPVEVTGRELVDPPSVPHPERRGGHGQGSAFVRRIPSNWLG